MAEANPGGSSGTNRNQMNSPSLFDSPASTHQDSDRQDSGIARRSLPFNTGSDNPHDSAFMRVTPGLGQDARNPLGINRQSGPSSVLDRQLNAGVNVTVPLGNDETQPGTSSASTMLGGMRNRVHTIQQWLMGSGDEINQRETAIRRIQNQLRWEGDIIDNVFSQSGPSTSGSGRPRISSVNVHVDDNAISVNVQATVSSSTSRNDSGQGAPPDVIDLTQERRTAGGGDGAPVVDLTNDEGYPLHRTGNVVDLTAVETVSSTDDEDDDDVLVGATADGDGSRGDDDTIVAMDTESGSKDNNKTLTEAGPSTSMQSEGDEGCPICFEEWSNSGEHRLVSLKCGHLFGQSCIETWLTSSKKCPQCNAKSKKTDLRVIYAKALKVLDTTERDQAVRALAREKEARNKTELEAAELRMKYQMIVEEHQRLKRDLEQQAHQQQISRVLNASKNMFPSTSLPKAGTSSQEKGSYVKLRDILVSTDGQCRVAAYSPALLTLVVSVPSTNPMFKNSFGVKKMSTIDFRNVQHVAIHKKTIRDMAFKPFADDGLLLSVSLDKSVKVTSLMTNTVVQSWDAPAAMWTCCWDSSNINYFYTGLVNGSIIQYDVRDTTKCVREFTNSCTKPVVSLCYIMQSQEFGCSGLLVGQMDEMTFYESQNNYFRPHKLAMPGNHGNVICLSQDVKTSNLLATYRPNPNIAKPAVTNQVFKLAYQQNAGISTVSTVSNQVFLGGSTMRLMTRSCLVNNPNTGLLTCVGDEASQSVHIWNVSSGNLVQSLCLNGTVVDTCAFDSNNTSFLASLTENRIFLYKWQSNKSY